LAAVAPERRLGLAQVRGIDLKTRYIISVPIVAERAVGPGAYELALVAQVLALVA
jgi:hypothetical protein